MILENIKKYNELKELLDQEKYNEITKRTDIFLIQSTNLKNYLIEKYLKQDYNYHKTNLEKFIKRILGEETFYSNKGLKKEALRFLAYNSLHADGFLGDNIPLSERKKLASDYLENIKNPNYSIKSPRDLRKSEEFIKYCLDNKNISILNNIAYKEEYSKEALKIIKEGYTITFDKQLNTKYKEALIKPLLEQGSLNNFNISLVNQKKELLPILIEQIKKGNHYEIDQNARVIFRYSYKNQPLEPLDEELINLLIENNQLEFINIIKPQVISNKMPKIIEKIMSGCKLKETDINIEDINLIKALIETNQFNFINNATGQAFYMNLDLFKQKLKTERINIITKVNDNINTRWIEAIQEDPSLLELLLSSDPNNIINLIDVINTKTEESHFEEIDEDSPYKEPLTIYNKDFYLATRTFLSEYYQVNTNNLDKFITRFGYNAICYLENLNIKTTINLEEKDFDKYMELFSYQPLNLENAKNIYDSIIQSRFKIDNIDDLNRLQKIKQTLISQETLLPIEELKVLANNINIKRLSKNKSLTKEDLKELENNPLEFLITCCQKIKNNLDIDKNMDILYKINREYLSIKREEYRKEHLYTDELELEYSYNKQSLVNALLKDLSLGTNELINEQEFYNLLDSYNNFNDLNDLSNPTPENIEKIKECLTFLRTDGKEFNTKQTKQNIGKLKDILKVVIDIEGYFNYNIKDCPYNIKKDYQLKFDDIHIFEILKNIDAIELKDTVLNNEEVYQSLKQNLQKYKFPEWDETFFEALTQSNLSLVDYDISSLITKYKELYKYTKRKQDNNEEVNLPEIINYANVLSSSSSRYQMLFEKENADLIKMDPKPNSSSESPNSTYRLDTSIATLLSLYKKDKITVPPINKSIPVNGNFISINLGNFTNPINLTYGERTGSCMRIKGTGNDLYDFCSKNENAFHIRLTDPFNKNFITRVSGFRNGNSIFLNQLRDSTRPSEYPNKDIIDATKKVAKMIIEESKNSDYPIENVFISPTYAFNKTSDKVIELEERMDDIKGDLPPFWFDLTKKAIVLATTSKDRDYVPIKKDIVNLPKYQTLRDTPKEHTNKLDIFNQVNKIKIIAEMLEKDDPSILPDIELIKEEELENIFYLINGEDWYIALDNNLETKEFIIPRNDNRALLELEKAREIINAKKEEHTKNGQRSR